MLFLGVEFSNMVCDISAVSSRFTFLGHDYFDFAKKDQLQSWIRSLILSDNEKLAWFFCEKSYHSQESYHSFFSLPGTSHTHYLVKDRVVLDFQRMIYEIKWPHYHSIIDLSLILAMSFNLFESKYINPYSNSEQLFLWP